MAVRVGVVGDEGLLRDLRLAALTDAPAAFGSTLERERARTPDDWRRWFSPGVTLFWLDEAGAGGGLVAAVPEADGGSAEVASMWVRPDLRGQGVGDALMDALIEWARDHGLPLRLHVVEDNGPAAALYVRHGFQPCDVRLRPDGVRETAMSRPVG